MRRSWTATAAVLAGLTLATLAGCGVPSSSEPIDRGTAPPARAQGKSVPNEPPGADAAQLPQDVVRLYLQAAAWGNSKSADRPGAIDAAERRLRGFLTPEGQTKWSPGDRALNLVRVHIGAAHPLADGSTTIDVTLDPVGVLDEFGSVRPAASTAPLHHTFRVVPVDGGHRRLVDAPVGFVMDVAALDSWYARRTIYFWAAGSTSVLAPDTR